MLDLSAEASSRVERGQQPQPTGQVWPADPQLPAKSAGYVSVSVRGTHDTLVLEPSTSLPVDARLGAEAAAIDRLLERVGLTEQAYDRAVRSPGDPSLVEALEATTVSDSPARLEFVEAYQDLVSQGRWTEPDPLVSNSVTMLPDALPIVAIDGRTAWVLVCSVSGDSLMQRDDSGMPIVLMDVRNAREVWQEFWLVDGEWLLFQRSQVEVYPEASSCVDVSVSSSVPAS